jgi:hypothetical protein
MKVEEVNMSDERPCIDCHERPIEKDNNTIFNIENRYSFAINQLSLLKNFLYEENHRIIDRKITNLVKQCEKEVVDFRKYTRIRDQAIASRGVEE